MNFKQIVVATIDTVKISTMIYFVVIGADMLGRMFAYIMLPQMITEWVISLNLGQLNFMLLVNGVLLAMGFFFSSFPMVIVVLPLFLPSVYSLGIDPIFYGSVAIMNSLIGEVTPPFGPQVWIAGPLCREKIGAIAREAWPFLGAWTAALLVTVLIPHIAMFLVNLFR
jgi:TRAP-type C4-dicarboxylate transport system permease large subunit